MTTADDQTSVEKCRASASSAWLRCFRATRARARGVLLTTAGPRRLRVVTHLDVDRGACERGAQVLCEVIAEAMRGTA